MKGRELQPLLRSLEARLRGFRRERRLLIRVPITDTLQGFCFYSSEWDKAGFYAHVFAQPLFVPAEHIVLSLGNRLKPGPFHLNEAETLTSLIEDGGLRFLRDFPATEKGPDAIPVLRKRVLDSAASLDLYSFMLARLGDSATAVLGLDRYVSLIREHQMQDGQYTSEAWARKVEQCLLLRELLLRDPAAAQRQLEIWRQYTLRALKLEKLASATASQTALASL